MMSLKTILILIGIAVIVFSQEFNLTYNLTLTALLLSYFAISAILNLLLIKSVPLRNIQEIS